MKVLFTHRPGGAYGYISDGWINSLRSAGMDARRWDGNPLTWRQFDPALYVGCSGHRQPIPTNRGNCKLAIHVNPLGPTDIKGITEGMESVDWVRKQKPDTVFGYGDSEDRFLWSWWLNKHNIPWVPMPNAADVCVYRKPVTRDREYDIVYVGGRWDYKAKTIDPYLLPVLKRFKSKLHGWGTWPDNLCAGRIGDDEVAGFFASGKVGPCISEQHTHQWGIDVPERAFKVAACGTVVVHDPTTAIRRFIPSAIVAQSPNEMLDEIAGLLSDDDRRVSVATAQQAEVFSGHTYHHRMAGLLRALGFTPQADAVLTALPTVLAGS